MKRIIYLFLLLMIGSIHYAYGDEIKSIKLDNREHKDTIISSPNYFNIFVELQQENEDGQYGISIKMENISENYELCLFDRSYNEKNLKKMHINYDKVFSGTKGRRVIDACNGISGSCILSPSTNKNIINIQGNENPINYRLPIYIARYNKKRTKKSLAQKYVIELNIDVELKPDEDLIRLTEMADSLIDEIGRQTFCSNKNHGGTPLSKMYSTYYTYIESVKKQVKQIISARGYISSSDKKYDDFMAIYNRLDSIDLKNLTVTSCANDKKIKPKPIHNCRFCSLSAKDIYNRMESYYIDLHNGKKSKEQVMNNVEALYNCVQKNKKRSTGNYMSRISKYYNEIRAYK